MNKEKLKKEISNILIDSKNSIYVKRYIHLEQEIIKQTKHLLSTATIHERIYNIINNIDYQTKCIQCNINPVTFSSFKNGYNKYCSNTCIALSPHTKEKKEKTCLNKYGVKYSSQNKQIIQKMKDTNLDRYGSSCSLVNKAIRTKANKTVQEKYGVNNVFQVDEFKDKFKTTMNNKYGVDNPAKIEEVKQKIQDKIKTKSKKEKLEIINKKKNTSLKNYGVDNPSKSNIIKQKTKEIMFKKYGVEYVGQIKETKKKNELKQKQIFLNKLNILLPQLNIKLIDSSYINSGINHTWECLLCNNKFITSWNNIQQGYKCPKCFPRSLGISTMEIDIFNYVRSILDKSVIVLQSNKQIITPQELDIYIPDKKIAIEFDGLYWHSLEKLNDKNYHINKTKKCEQLGIKLIHIFEDEWLFKKDIVESRLSQILSSNNVKRIHARKCVIKEIIPKIKNEFLEKYHIQGKDSSVIKLGAFYQDELISVMTFSKGNISKGSLVTKNIWELNRFCSNSNYHIPGIASKLLTYFKRNYKWKDIFSYADRRWSDGNVYYQLGFNLVGDTGINYWYVKDFQRIHRFNLRRDKETPKELTEQEWRVSQGYSIIYDCGSLKFNLTK